MAATVSHLGVEKCLSRAREGQLQVVKFVLSKGTIKSMSPYYLIQFLIDLDMSGVSCKKFVVLVDYYSKYFELTQLKDSTSASVINCLKQHM